MSLFSAIVKVAIDTALLPVAVVKDIVTLGNCCNDRSYTAQKIDDIKEDSEDA